MLFLRVITWGLRLRRAVSSSFVTARELSWSHKSSTSARVRAVPDMMSCTMFSNLAPSAVAALNRCCLSNQHTLLNRSQINFPVATLASMAFDNSGCFAPGFVRADLPAAPWNKAVAATG